jgi:predicted RNase H-like HicB family nuclease
VAKKSLKYYMSLPYEVRITPVPDYEGGGFIAYLPQLKSYALFGDGETEEQALANLEEVKKDRFKEYLKEGLSIPEPGQGGWDMKKVSKELREKAQKDAKAK